MAAGAGHTISTMDKIGASDLQSMISHWLATPVNCYLGSGYGADPKSMLHAPLRTGLADAFLNKMRSDVPLVGALPRGAVNLYSVDQGPDKQTIFIEAAGQTISLGNN